MCGRRVITIAAVSLCACTTARLPKPAEPEETADPEIGSLAQPNQDDASERDTGEPVLPAGDSAPIDPRLAEPREATAFVRAARTELAAAAGIEIVGTVAPPATGFALAGETDARIAVFIDVDDPSGLPPPPPPGTSSWVPQPVARLLIDAPVEVFATVATRDLFARPTATRVDDANAPGFVLAAGTPITAGAAAGTFVEITRDAPLWRAEGYVPEDGVGRVYTSSRGHSIVEPAEPRWLAPGTVVRAKPGGAPFATLAPPPDGADRGRYAATVLRSKGRHRLVAIAGQGGFMSMLGHRGRLVGWVEAAEVLAEPAPGESSMQFGFGAPSQSSPSRTLALPAGTRLWLPDGDAPVGVVYRAVDAVYLGEHRGRAMVELSTDLGTLRLGATGPR